MVRLLLVMMATGAVVAASVRAELAQRVERGAEIVTVQRE
jgi:hypothetical protein